MFLKDIPKDLHNLHSGLSFLSERMKAKKYNKIVCNSYDSKDYVVYIRAVKQALNRGLIFKKLHRVIQFNQEASLTAYSEINTKLRTKAKKDYENFFFKLMNNSFFRKTMENVRKHRDIKLVTTSKKKSISV